jgi:hypothetical protein
LSSRNDIGNIIYEIEIFETKKKQKNRILPLKLFPHARNVKPRIVLLILKIIPNVVNKLTISFAIE